MYYDTTRLTALRIAEGHRQADLERSLRPTEPTKATKSLAEPIPALMTGPAPTSVDPIVAVAAGCGDCRPADRAA